MRGGVDRIRSEKGAESGVTPVVGLALLIGIVFIGIALVLFIGVGVLDGIESEASAERGEQLMVGFDKDLTTSLLNPDASGAVYLDEDGSYELIDGGSVSIAVSNGYEDPKEVDEISMGTLRYEDASGNVFGYQAGGIWQVEDGATSMVSSPNLRYYTEVDDGEEVGRIDLSVTDLQGNVGQGEHTVTGERSESSGIDDVIDEVGFVSYVEITISDTPYHDAWYDFLKSEFDAVDADDGPTNNDNVIEHRESDREVTVTAIIDGKNPFANQVGIDPTVYGGLYVDSVDPEYDSKTTFTAYDDHDANTGVSEDLFVVNEDLVLGSSANISGVPVTNGKIDVGESSGAKLSPLGYAAGLTDYDGVTEDGNTGYVWHNDRNVLVANMSSGFSPVDPITDELADSDDGAIASLSEREELVRFDETDVGDEIDDGLYYGPTFDDDIETIDTSSGDVHIGIDGDLLLEGVEIVGDNHVYIYTDGDVVAGDVTVPDERADALWVYGTSSNTITVTDRYEGVIYAPGSDLVIDNDVDIYGAIAAGNLASMGDDVTVNFDRTLRTDVPIPEENRDLSIEEEYRPPLDVTFVLDRSGSMSSNDPDNQRVDATRDFIGLLEDGDKAGVFEFDHHGYTVHDLSPNLETVNNSVRGIADGWTDHRLGMELATDAYDDTDNQERDRIMVLLSDGANQPASGIYCWFSDIPSCGHTSEELDTMTLAQAEAAAEKNITIYTVGLGLDDLNEELLQDIAEITGGQNVNVDDAEELEDIFEGIAADVTAGSDLTFEVQSLSQSNGTSGNYVLNIETQEAHLEN